MSGQQSLFSHRYSAVLASGSKPLPKGWNGLERTGNVGKNELHLPTLPKEMPGGDSALLKVVTQPPWKQSVATLQFLFSYPGGKKRLLYMHRQSGKAPNPHSEIPSLIQVQLLMSYAASLALNTSLLLSPGSYSWSPQGSYKGNFRTYSNFWCWGDENSPSACSQRISRSKVRSFIGLTVVVSYMFTFQQKPYSNISPAVLFAAYWAGHNAYLWMHSVLPICRCWLTWFITLPDINQWSWNVLL